MERYYCERRNSVTGIGMYETPSFQDVLKARKRISPYLLRTPLHYYPTLSATLGFEVYIKHENHQPTGSFKVRGGINLISQLSEEEHSRGVITASTGNHGQSIAYASKLFNVKATVLVPKDANPDKVESMRSMGANVILHGKDFEESRIHAEDLSREQGYRYIHAANEPLLIAGVGTMGLEIIEDLPEVDVILVPIGGGTEAAGTSIVVKALKPAAKVIGVQSEGAPSFYLSWKQGRIVETDSVKTIADGLATRKAFELTLQIFKNVIEDFVLVSDDEIRSAIKLLLIKTHNLAEGAGAASTAAAVKLKERLQGKKVALVLSGGNLNVESLKEILNR
jgi:threonine dehydratase